MSVNTWQTINTWVGGGAVTVTGQTPNYSYQAISGIVGTGEVQVIGKVTANFKADLYSSGFKPSEITVTFKQ